MCNGDVVVFPWNTKMKGTITKIEVKVIFVINFYQGFLWANSKEDGYKLEILKFKVESSMSVKKV